MPYSDPTPVADDRPGYHGRPYIHHDIMEQHGCRLQKDGSYWCPPSSPYLTAAKFKNPFRPGVQGIGEDLSAGVGPVVLLGAVAVLGGLVMALRHR